MRFGINFIWVTKIEKSVHYFIVFHSHIPNKGSYFPFWLCSKWTWIGGWTKMYNHTKDFLCKKPHHIIRNIEKYFINYAWILGYFFAPAERGWCIGLHQRCYERLRHLWGALCTWPLGRKNQISHCTSITLIIKETLS